MKSWIAFIRGINVGGTNKLPMKDLKGVLEEANFTRVRTYIQSGNVIFEHPANDRSALAAIVAEQIDASHGFRPQVVVLSSRELTTAVKANPFDAGNTLDKILHLFFLAQRPTAPDFARMDAIKGPTEQYALLGDVFYLYTPDGFGTSKLAQRAEKLLGVNTTARNWRTVNNVLKLSHD